MRSLLMEKMESGRLKQIEIKAYVYDVLCQKV